MKSWSCFPFIQLFVFSRLAYTSNKPKRIWFSLRDDSWRFHKTREWNEPSFCWPDWQISSSRTRRVKNGFLSCQTIYKCIPLRTPVCHSLVDQTNGTAVTSLLSARLPLRGADIDHRIISFFARRTTADSPSGCYSLYLMKNQNSISKSTVPMPSVATKPQSSTPDKPAEPLSNSSEQEPKSTTDQVEWTCDRLGLVFVLHSWFIQYWSTERIRVF